MSLKAALDALSDDAKVWDAASTTAGTAGKAAAALDIGLYSWPQVIADVPLSDTYNKLQSKIEKLLGEGQTETANIAATLRKVRTAYESTDSSAAKKLHGVWDPII